MLELGSGLPVAGAQVRIGAVEATTDGSGRIDVELPAGTWTVEIAPSDRHSGGTFEVDLVAGEVLGVKLRVAAASVTEVQVYGEREAEEVERRVYDIEELRRIPGSFGDPVRALQSVPGVARPAGLEGALVVRGQEALNTGTFVDGVRVPFLFHLLVGRSVVDPHVIEDVEFYPGGMPSRFGDVTAGVVNLRTRFDAAEPGLHGTVHFDLLDTGATVAADLGAGWTLRAGGRQAWVSGVILAGTALVASTSEEYGPGERPATIGLPYHDYHLRLVHNDDHERISVTMFGAKDGIRLVPERVDRDQDGRPDPIPELPAFVPFDPDELVSNSYTRVVVRHDLDRGRTEAETWAAVGFERQHNIVPGLGVFGTGPEFGAVRAGLFQLRRDGRTPVTEHADVRVGGDLRVQPSEVEGYIDVLTRADVPVTVDQRLWASPFVEWQQRSDRWFVAPGLRGSLHQVAGRQDLVAEPRLSVRHTLTDTWTATAFAGRFSQQPPPDRVADGIGNPEIGVVKAWQGSAGLQGRWPAGGQIDLSAYASLLDDLVVRDTRITIAPPPTDLEDTAVALAVPEYEAVTGWAWGAELSARMRPAGPWFGWVSLTLSRSLRRGEDGTFPGDYDIPVSLVTVGSLDLGRAWTVGARGRVGSGQPYTPLNAVFLPDEDLYTALPGPRNGSRFPVYKQVDLRIDKTWTGKRARTMLYLDMYNALNHRNYLQATYNFDFSELVRVLWIPVIPTLGVEVAY